MSEPSPPAEPGPSTSTKRSIADRLLWIVVVLVFLGHFIPLLIAAIVPLFVYPVVVILGVAELHHARQTGSPFASHYLLSPVYACILGVLHLLALVAKKPADLRVLAPLFLAAILAWPVVWGISRLLLRWSHRNVSRRNV